MLQEHPSSNPNPEHYANLSHVPLPTVFSNGAPPLPLLLVAYRVATVDSARNTATSRSDLGQSSLEDNPRDLIEVEQTDRSHHRPDHLHPSIRCVRRIPPNPNKGLLRPPM
ncbi:hypothetical protein B296_00021191 [Ensete ventricosum]|uniref:Uncharacterized protein n=1 Tax=Ensete ventricosum TaxID=4639 RepID=A0A427B018_ENSVE|nr:hypothetical protein B296_00021191 [Ensete ventricosum]